jgi:hypothetical protein
MIPFKGIFIPSSPLYLVCKSVREGKGKEKRDEEAGGWRNGAVDR